VTSENESSTKMPMHSLEQEECDERATVATPAGH